jgi:hypothetical protein
MSSRRPIERSRSLGSEATGPTHACPNSDRAVPKAKRPTDPVIGRNARQTGAKCGKVRTRQLRPGSTRIPANGPVFRDRSARLKIVVSPVRVRVSPSLLPLCAVIYVLLEREIGLLHWVLDWALGPIAVRNSTWRTFRSGSRPGVRRSVGRKRPRFPPVLSPVRTERRRPVLHLAFTRRADDRLHRWVHPLLRLPEGHAVPVARPLGALSPPAPRRLGARRHQVLHRQGLPVSRQPAPSTAPAGLYRSAADDPQPERPLRPLHHPPGDAKARDAGTWRSALRGGCGRPRRRALMCISRATCS